ncbi:MAG: hypothetical protein K0S11_1477, partial [Gammaproteobacteria bacterium]|nr:hypothetical protein [Gammaproteobacteria bacterium]
NLSTAQKSLLKEQFQFLIEKLKLEVKQDLERAEYIQKNNGFHTRLLNNLERYTQYCRKSIKLIEQRSEDLEADQMVLAKAVKDQTIPKEATADQTLLIEASFMLQRCEPMVEKLNRGDTIFDNELLNTIIRDIPGQFITWLERPELTQEEIAKLSARARQELELMPIFTLDDKSFASQVRSLKELLSVIANFAKVLREIVENSADDITGDLQNLLHGQHIKGIASILGYNPTELAQKTRQSLAVPINKAEEPQKQEELLGTATNQSFIPAHFDAKLTQQELITESNLISANPLMESIDMEDVGIADLNDKRQALEKRWNKLRKTLLPNNLGQAPIPEFAYPKDLTVSSHCFAITGLREGLEKAVKQLEKIKKHHARHSPERLRIVAFLNGLQDKHIVKVKQEAGTTTYAYIRSLAPSTNKPASSTNRMFSRFAKSPEKIDTKQERDLIQLTELYSQGAYINPQITVLMEQLIKSNNKLELQGIKDNQLSEVMAYLTTEHQKEYFAEFSKICGTPEVRISKSANPATVTRLTEQQIKTDLKTSTENAKKLITNTEQAIFGYFKSGYLGGYDYLKYVQDQATLLRRNLDNNGLNEKECEYYNSLKKQFKWEKSSTYQKRDNSATIYAEILAIKYLIAKCDELPYDFDVSKTAKLGNELNERCADLLTRIKLSINNISDTKSTFRANLDQVLQTFQDLSPNNSKMEHKP